MAGRIPDSTLEEIRLRTDLADLVSSYGINVKRAGGGYMACCPFHHEKTPSFSIQPEKGFYHCFGCGESGDVFKFVQKQEGLGFMEAVKKLAQQCGVEIKENDDPEAGKRARLYALHAELAAFFRRCLLKAKEAEPARTYLKSRDLSGEIGEKFCIGYAPKGDVPLQRWAEKYKFKPEELSDAGVLLPPREGFERWYNRFGGRLMFTIRDRAGRPVAFSGRVLANDKKAAKYVNSPETPIFRKSNILFALDQAAGNIAKAARREAIVCEGQIDVIRCHACGFNTAVASQGTSFTTEHVRLLKRCADSAVLVFDGDWAGQKAAIRTGGEFLAAEIPVRVATLPSGEDPDSLLRTKGPEAFQACLDAAESITSFQVRTLRAKEANPDSIDAVARVSRAVLTMLAACPSAIMREALMDEAANLLRLPVSALKEDLAKLGGERSRASATGETPVAPVQRVGRPSSRYATGGTSAVPDEYDGGIPSGIDAAAPENNPPPARERALCEFLFDHERDVSLAGMVERYATDDVLTHPFTRLFVAAWRKGCGDGGGLEALLDELPPAECAWLNEILMSNDRSGLSELSPERILQDFLRQLWMEAVRRRQGALPAESTPENDLKRLNYSTCIRRLQRDAWNKASALMTPGLLT
ncbi:MAG: DNA primase [Kiritimatiellae bacterium]|nr:DNA primase [Kiritimatiellia bacterium]